MLVAVLGYASRVDLRIAGICESRAALVATVGGGYAATLGVCREIENVAVAARAEENNIGGISFDFSRDEVADDNALWPLRRP